MPHLQRLYLRSGDMRQTENQSDDNPRAGKQEDEAVRHLSAHDTLRR